MIHDWMISQSMRRISEYFEKNYECELLGDITIISHALEEMSAVLSDLRPLRESLTKLEKQNDQ